MTATRPVIYLHIGAMKTGTTFLQNLMVANKERLAEAGYLFPGDTWSRQVRAVQDVIDGTRGDPRIEAQARGAWDAMARQMLDHTGAASILSMEFLSFANARRAKRVVTSLDPAEVHVILTVRDAAGTIPAQWQTSVHNGSTVGWEEFTREIRTEVGLGTRLVRRSPLARLAPDPEPQRFRRAQDAKFILRSWSRHLDPARIHVVTVPPSGSDPRLLWERFAGVVGLDPDVCSEPPARANESLGYASTELLRRVNLELGPLRPTDYNATLKEGIALRVLSQRSGEETRARIDSATYKFALAWNERVRRAILDTGAQVVGDLDDLPTSPSETLQRKVDDAQAPPTDDELLAAAAAAAEGLRRMIARRSRRLRDRGAGDVVADDHATAASEGWARSADPVAAAVSDIADLARTAIDLNRRLQR